MKQRKCIDDDNYDVVNEDDNDYDDVNEDDDDDYFDNDNEDINDNGDQQIRGETSLTSKFVSWH